MEWRTVPIERQQQLPIDNWLFPSAHNWTLTTSQLPRRVLTINSRRLRNGAPIDQITIVGGGLAGLTAAITAAEQDGRVRLLEAHAELVGRARSTGAPYKVNLGPHALFSSSPLWAWLGERRLLPPCARPPLSGVRFRWRDELPRVPAVGATAAALRLRLRNRSAPCRRRPPPGFRSAAGARSSS